MKRMTVVFVYLLLTFCFVVLPNPGHAVDEQVETALAPSAELEAVEVYENTWKIIWRIGETGRWINEYDKNGNLISIHWKNLDPEVSREHMTSVGKEQKANLSLTFNEAQQTRDLEKIKEVTNELMINNWPSSKWDEAENERIDRDLMELIVEMNPDGAYDMMASLTQHKSNQELYYLPFVTLECAAEYVENQNDEALKEKAINLFKDLLHHNWKWSQFANKEERNREVDEKLAGLIYRLSQKNLKKN